MHIGHVALRTADLAGYTKFLAKVLGLRTTARGESEVTLSANEKHHEIQLLAGERPAFDHVGLELETEEELEAVCETALAAGARHVPTEATEAGLTRAVRLEDPSGIVYELYTSDRAEPDGYSFLREGIRRLGHLTFFSENPAKIIEFWVEGLGFRISDEADGFAWLRCDTDHHGLAVGTRPGETSLHHHAWEVQDLSALGQYCDSIAIEGHRLLWGPVRHGPGYNLATYLPDPDGGVVEVYSDMLRITDEATYRRVDWSKVPDALNLWGPMPPERLLVAGLPVLSALSGAGSAA